VPEDGLSNRFFSESSAPQPDERSPAEQWDHDATRRVLDELFSLAKTFNSSKSYLEFMEFIGRFRLYSPFNAILIYTQMPGARFVATPRRWMKEFYREIKAGARPVVILQPMGPVLFVFDISDTEQIPGAPSVPEQALNPFHVYRGQVGDKLDRTIENAKRDGIRVSEADHGSQQAGSIQWASHHQFLDVLISPKANLRFKRVPLWYELLLNSSLSPESKYATLVHELGHLYCGHLGTPDKRRWPDRRGLPTEVCEFEAESICYLVCTRLGLENASAEYLAGYVRRYETTPPISLDRVIKSSWLIEQMGKARLPLWKDSSNDIASAS
jgi:hypothetical protein